MPASIILKHLSYAHPDGQSLFTDLDLTFGAQRTGLVGRNSTGKSTLLKLIAGQLSPSSGEIIALGSLGWMRQLAQLEAGGSVAQALGVAADLERLGRLDSGEGSIDDAAQADWTLPDRITAALARLGLPPLPPERALASLSGGQRSRVLLAGLLVANPDVILLDEPTNNLDAAGRAAVFDLLGQWRGGAIIASHDRELLEQVDAMVELTTLGVTSYGGNWQHYTERKALALAAADQHLATAQRQLNEVDRRVQQTAERQQRRDSAGKRSRARNDLPKILLGARKNKAEQTGGRQNQLAERLRSAATETLVEARGRVEVLTALSVKLASSGLAAGKTILHCDRLVGGPVPGHPVVSGLSFTMVGPERLALAGPNGSGKTTLLRLLTGELAAQGGTARIFGRFAVLDQSMGLLQPDLSIRDNFLRLNPGADENTCRAALARFMFRAEASQQAVGALSGGEILRAGLAAVIGGTHPPELLILDEPTNHLDLFSIEALEAGLRAYDGALLVVSHDQRFLREIGVERVITLGQL